MAWLPAFLACSFSMSAGSIGTWLALIIGIAGGAGTFLGGCYGDRLAQRGVRWSRGSARNPYATSLLLLGFVNIWAAAHFFWVRERSHRISRARSDQRPAPSHQ